MEESSDSGFIKREDAMIDTTNKYHDIREVARTSHSVLSTAMRGGKRWMLKSLSEEKRNDPLYIALLKKEHDTLSKLDHPYIVKAYEMTEVDGLGQSIVMEYVNGETLNKAKLSKRERIRAARQIGEALQYIHQCQMVHRDIKPSNIMVTTNGHFIKIIDFGLADTDAYTILKQPGGTAKYMSQEQATESKPDIRNDIYSLGKVYREMRLGWRYKRMTQRMLKPIEKRTPTMEEVLKDFDDAGKSVSWAWYGITAIAGAACIAGIIYYIQQNNTENKGENKDTTITAINKKATEETKEQKREREETTAPATTKQTTTAGKEKCEWKEAIDVYIKKTHFAETVDTLTTLYSEAPQKIHSTWRDLNIMIDEYAKKNSKDEDEAANLRKQMSDYATNKYWTKYYTRSVEILEKERKMKEETDNKIKEKMPQIIKRTEKKWGKKAETTRDFVDLSGSIEKATGDKISTNTLMMMWGATAQERKFTVKEANILANYCELKSWKDF